MLRSQAERLGDRVACALWILGTCPNFAIAVLYNSQRVGGLDRPMCHIRRNVGMLDNLFCIFLRHAEVPPDSSYRSILHYLLFQFLYVCGRIVSGVGTQVPFHLQQIPRFDGGPGIVGHHGDAAQWFMYRRRYATSLDDNYFEDPGHCQGLIRFIGFYVPSDDRAAFYRGVFHIVYRRIDAEDRLPDYYIMQIDTGCCTSAHLKLSGAL